MRKVASSLSIVECLGKTGRMATNSPVADSIATLLVAVMERERSADDRSTPSEKYGIFVKKKIKRVLAQKYLKKKKKIEGRIKKLFSGVWRSPRTMRFVLVVWIR